MLIIPLLSSQNLNLNLPACLLPVCLYQNLPVPACKPFIINKSLKLSCPPPLSAVGSFTCCQFVVAVRSENTSMCRSRGHWCILSFNLEDLLDLQNCHSSFGCMLSLSSHISRWLWSIALFVTTFPKLVKAQVFFFSDVLNNCKANIKCEQSINNCQNCLNQIDHDAFCNKFSYSIITLTFTSSKLWHLLCVIFLWLINFLWHWQGQS